MNAAPTNNRPTIWRQLLYAASGAFLLLAAYGFYGMATRSLTAHERFPAPHWFLTFSFAAGFGPALAAFLIILKRKRTKAALSESTLSTSVLLASAQLPVMLFPQVATDWFEFFGALSQEEYRAAKLQSQVVTLTGLTLAVSILVCFRISRHLADKSQPPCGEEAFKCQRSDSV